jgi:hypothetical protein
MSSIQKDEIRYYQWGDEPVGKVSAWTINEDRSVKILGYFTITELKDMMEKQNKGLVMECPYS